MKKKQITVDGVTYYAEDKAEQMDGLEYVICRTQSAGVFAGYLANREGKEVVLRQARRLWYWDGAASLSQLSVDGVAKPGNCKFPCEVPSVVLTEAIEILPCSRTAQLSIASVPVWQSK